METSFEANLLECATKSSISPSYLDVVKQKLETTAMVPCSPRDVDARLGRIGVIRVAKFFPLTCVPGPSLSTEKRSDFALVLDSHVEAKDVSSPSPKFVSSFSVFRRDDRWA